MQTHVTIRQTDTQPGPRFIDITDAISEAYAESGIASGRVTVIVDPSECRLVVNEFESGLISDLIGAIERMGEPARDMLGAGSIVLPCADGKLALGVWQRVLLVELDGGGPREVTIQTVGI